MASKNWKSCREQRSLLRNFQHTRRSRGSIRHSSNKFRGLNAVTNFEINRYDVKIILVSSTLPIGGGAKHLKDAENAEMALDIHRANEAGLNLHLPDGSVTGYGNGSVA
ncbi:hypothetical protein ACS0TY_002758 [Phlomoides rotata]